MKSILTSLFSLVLCAALHAQIPSYVPADGLVGWWPFNGNANDESGNGNHGVVNGATLAEDRFGNANAAYSFDGNDGITMPPSDILNIGLSDFTISLFIKPSNIEGSNKNIIGKRYYSLGNGYSVNIENGRVFSDLLDANSTTYTGSTSEVALNEWQHVCATFDRDGNSSIYLNGQLEGSLPISGESGDLSNSSELFIGYFAPVGPDCFNGCLFFEGSIDDIAIYNRALTPAEITQLYTAAEEPVATCAPLAPNLQNGLVGYWPFCGNANDESGNGNNGVVNGATLAEDRYSNPLRAYSFNETDGNVGFISMQNPLSNLSSFSVSFWIKRNIELTDSWIMMFYSNNGSASHEITSSSSSIAYRNFNQSLGQTNFDLVSPVNWTDNFHQFTFVIDGYNISTFMNGILLNSANSNNIGTSIDGDFFVGKHALFSDNSGLDFDGSLDDIAIWNRALTPEEITQLYTGAAAPCNLIASETQDTPVEVGGSAQMYVTLNATDYSMQWQTNAAGLGWMDVQDNNTYTGSQTQNLLISNATLANHEQPFRIIVTDGICNDTSDVALLLVNNTCTAFDTITTTIEVFDTLTIENVVEVYDTLTIYNTIDVFDTTNVTIEVFDTITNVVDVFDTTTIYLQVDIFDTLFIDVYDTTFVQQTIDVYDTTYVTLTDTTYIQVIDTAYVTVTDTLLIDITFVGFEGQPSWLNTLLVYPNPASDHITIDYGNFALMAGYNTVITDAAGATVYSGAVNSQQAYIDINAWGAAGVYYLSVYDVNGTVVAVRQIVLE